MICASWTWDMFNCLVDGKNHEPCCRRKGVPDVCSNFCAGNTTAERLSHKHFRCERYMPAISNCFMEDYDVLPSEPRNFYFSNVGTNIGLLHWEKPILHGDSVKHYLIHIDRSTAFPIANKIGEGTVKIAKSSPFVLEGLEPSTSYITYVEAVNDYGPSPMSSIAVFRTASRRIGRPPAKAPRYDQKQCCSSAGVKDECLNLCRFNASITEARKLAPLCKEDFHRITKCQSAGRDHLPCCSRRGVGPECLGLCQGTQVEEDSSVYGTCITYIGNIMTCLEEGVLTLPAPVTGFHAQYVDDTKVTFSWDLPDNSTVAPQVQQYEVYYKELRNQSGSGVFAYDRNINVTGTTRLLTIKGLTPNTDHQFFVVARNQYGTSLPTSLITVNTSRVGWNGQRVDGLPSPPHEIQALTGADTIQLSWTAPAVSAPDDYHKYRITYRPMKNESQQTTVETSSTNLKLSKLQSNTQYVIYLTTIQVPPF